MLFYVIGTYFPQVSHGICRYLAMQRPAAHPARVRHLLETRVRACVRVCVRIINPGQHLHSKKRPDKQGR